MNRRRSDGPMTIIVIRTPEDEARAVRFESMTPARGDRSWCTAGAFLRVSPASEVVCALCREPFPTPHEKADHLVLDHLAKTRKAVDREGNDLYEWWMPGGGDQRPEAQRLHDVRNQR